MIVKLYLCLFALLILYGSCNSKSADKQPTSPTALETGTPTQPAANSSVTQPSAASSAVPAFDICSLLSGSEIAAVQGTAVQESKSNSRLSGELEISQCYYTAVSADGKNLSVHLQVIQHNPKSSSAEGVNDYWNERFRQRNKEDKSTVKGREEREAEEEESGAQPVSVPGIGSEAFWVASGKGGALFVRKDGKLLRISIGGAATDKSKIQKSKTLARKALARLK
jgi:hypothetical protein